MCDDPATLNDLLWFACYLTTGKHLAFYLSFGTVLLLLAVTAPAALGLGFYTLHNSFQTQVTEVAPQARGSAVALHAFSFFCGQALGPVSVGFGLTRLGVAPTMLLGALMLKGFEEQAVTYPLVLGGFAIIASIIGALFVHGLRPGPLLLTETPHLFWFTVGNLALANVFLLLFGLAGARAFARIAEVPRAVLIPLILVLCTVGTFAIRNSMADVAWMAAFGVAGYLLRLYGFQAAPIILGMILGPLMDASWRRTVISAGDSVAEAAVEAAGSAISLVLVAAIVFVLLRAARKARA